MRILGEVSIVVVGSWGLDPFVVVGGIGFLVEVVGVVEVEFLVGVGAFEFFVEGVVEGIGFLVEGVVGAFEFLVEGVVEGIGFLVGVGIGFVDHIVGAFDLVGVVEQIGFVSFEIVGIVGVDRIG